MPDTNPASTTPQVTTTPAAPVTQTPAGDTPAATGTSSAPARTTSPLVEKYSRFYDRLAGIEEPASTQTQTAPPAANEQVTQLLSQLNDRLARLESSGQTATPAGAAAATEAKSIIQYLQAGDAEGFENALVARLSEALGGTLLQETTSRSFQAANAAAEIRTEAAAIRRDFPELSNDMDLIELNARQWVQLAKDQKIIKSTEDYVDAWKVALRKSAERLRNIAASGRADGRQEANTRSREVLATSPTSSAASPGVGTSPAPQDLPQNSLDSTRKYLDLRKSQASRMQGMGR